MSPTLRVTAFVATLAVATCSFAADVPKGIRAAYKRVSQTIVKCDFTAFKTLFAEDFKSTDPSGKTISREEFFKAVEPLFSSNTSGTLNEKFISCKEHDGQVDVEFDAHVVMKGKQGKTHIREVGVDSWKKIGGKWLMVATVDKTFDVKMPEAPKPKGKAKS